MFEKVVTEHGLTETEFWTSVIGTEGGIESTIQRTVWIDDTSTETMVAPGFMRPVVHGATNHVAYLLGFALLATSTIASRTKTQMAGLAHARERSAPRPMCGHRRWR